MWKWLEQYFTFTKGERNAVIVLVILALAVLIIPRAYFFFKPVEHVSNSKYDKEIADFTKEYTRNNRGHSPGDTIANSEAGLAANPENGKKDSAYTYRKKPAERYFVFDPNKIGVKEWIKLGFTEKQAITIEHYKATGAKFYKPVDLKRLYVMSDEHYEKLLPYVKIDVAALPEKRHNQ